MRRAALSVMNSIAEGFERRTKKDFTHFLDLAKGSAGEVRSMTFAAEDVDILRVPEAEKLRMAYETLARRISYFPKAPSRVARLSNLGEAPFYRIQIFCDAHLRTPQ